jgi:hypothetical protein
MEQLIARLAVGEQVSWAHLINGFEFPPETMRKEIEEAAQDAKIVVRTSAHEG